MSTWWERRLSNANDPTKAAASVPAPPRLPEAVRPSRPAPAPEDLCPNCASENYLAATRLTAKRCYDCGYPVVQSGTGVSGSQGSAPVKKATQVQSGAYSPGVIVGRVE